MTFAEHIVQLLGSASGAVVLLAMLVTGAAFALGIGVNHPERFLDARQWMEAVSDCLRSL